MIQMKKEMLKTLLKFVVAGGIIYWMVSSGKLDFSLLKKAFSHPLNITIVVVLSVFNLFATSWRWKKLMEAKLDHKLPFWNITRINWIGLFFNTVLPGMVSGDLVKIFYVRSEEKALSKRFLLASVFVDRIIGLFSLISLLGIFSIFNYNTLRALSPEVKMLVDLNLLLFAAVVFSFLSLYFFKNLPYKLTPLFKVTKITDAVWERMLLLWENLVDTRKRLIGLTVLGIFIHTAAVVMFWVIASPYAEGSFDLKYAFSFVPLGFVAIAIPIAPSGLGVGHVIFDKLFSFFNVMNGASLLISIFSPKSFSILLGSFRIY
jgi:uncharacterized membrane protein YbhN (UPF0104 family)